MSESEYPPAYVRPHDGYGSSIVQLTNPEPLIEEMELTFRGKKKIKGQVEQVGDALMNEKGINSVTGQVRSCLNQVAIMSNLDKNTISTLMIGLSDTLSKDLMMNRINYNITLPVARDRIVTIATNCAFVGLKRAESEGDRRFWKGSQQEITYRTEDGSKNNSIWNSIMGKR